MARKPNKPPVIDKPEINHEQFDADHAALNELARMNAETADNAQALAAQFGYEGALTVGAVEDEIRHYQRRTAEACFELGKRLLILKELTPHGEFKQRIELLEIGYESAKKFMAISAKFSKGYSNTLLKSVQTQTKLLELLVLDDSEIEELDAGETVRGLNLDKIDTMSVRELKAALREAHEDAKATDKVLGNVTGQKHALEKELEKTKQRVAKEAPDETEAALRDETNLEAFAAGAVIAGRLRPSIKTLIEHGQANDRSHEEFIVGLLCQIEREISVIRNEFSLKDAPDGDERPSWDTPEAQEKAAKLVAEGEAKRTKRIKGSDHE